MIFCMYTFNVGICLFFSGTPRTLKLMYFFHLRCFLLFDFSFLFHYFSFHWNIYNSYLDFCSLLSTGINSLFSPCCLFSWLFTFVFSTGLLSVGWPFSSVSEDGVGDTLFDSVILNPSWLMMHLVGIPPGFSKNFSYCLVPKLAFIFLCLRGYFIRKLRGSLSDFHHQVESLTMLIWKSRFSNLKCLQTSRWYIFCLIICLVFFLGFTYKWDHVIFVFLKTK